MLVTKCPLRISLFGGGTDFREWFTDQAGATLSCTVDKYVYVTTRAPFHTDRKFKLAYSKIESRDRLEDVRQPVIRAVLNYLKYDRPIEIHYDADVPGGTGLATSSAFVIALLKSIYIRSGQPYDKKKLATDAIRIERDLMGEKGGIQDQIICSYGGFRHILYNSKYKDGFCIKKFNFPKLSLSLLERNLMLLYLGSTRSSSRIEGQKITQIRNRSEQYRRNYERVSTARDILQNADQESIDEIGYLLHESWLDKSALATSVSNREIDAIYERAINAGALGGKVLGAGGGGFMLLYCNPKKRKAVREALAGNAIIPFRFIPDGPSGRFI